MKRMTCLAGCTAIVLSMAAIGRAADDDLISTRRDDDLISTRRDDDLLAPLGPDRTEPRQSLQQRVERELDRGTGRIEDEQTHELNRMELERAEQNGAPRRSAWQRLEDERDRQIRLEQRQQPAEHAAERQRIVERESEKLHEQREAFYQSIGQGMTFGGRQHAAKLDGIDRDYYPT